MSPVRAISTRICSSSGGKSIEDNEEEWWEDEDEGEDDEEDDEEDEYEEEEEEEEDEVQEVKNACSVASRDNSLSLKSTMLIISTSLSFSVFCVSSSSIF
jgi:hypothetical protein